MREHPDLEQLRHQARELLNAFLASQPDAIAEIATYYRGANAETFALHHAQLVLARAYGFESWPKLKAYVDGITVKTLKDAIRGGDLESVRSMLRIRPELIGRNLSGGGDRPIHHAVVERKPEMVRLLMEHGANARMGMHLAGQRSNYPTAFDLATERGYDDIASIIREAEQKRPPEEPPNRPEESLPRIPDELTRSFRDNDEDRAIEILEANPALVRAHRDGVTPLHAAAALLLEKMAAWLLDHGADVNARSKWGEGPLEVAGLGTKEGIERLKSMTGLLLARGAEQTPYWAIRTSNTQWLRARYAAGTLGNPVYGGRGLLTLAVKFDRPEILTWLLDVGYDPDERRRLDLEPAEDTWGQPLRDCAEHGKLAMAEMLLAHGADPNAHIYASGTPLFVAYGEKNKAMIELLERHGGYLDAEMVGWLGLVDKAGELLAGEAAGRLRNEAIPDRAERTPIAELLLIGGVNHSEMLKLALPRITRARDDPWWAGKLDESVGRGGLDSLRLLLDRCDVPKSAPGILHSVTGSMPVSQEFRPDLRAAKAVMLLDAGAPLDFRDGWQKTTPLGSACDAGLVELVKLFLSRGADPVEADAEPWAAPLASAERRGRQDILALLREATR
jgi:ankyrin repeat protein